MTPDEKKQLEESIINALKAIYDPEIPVDIYELGLIYDVVIHDDASEVKAEVVAKGAVELLLLQGRPIGEPVVSYGPFVMNSREEIEQAIADYRGNRLV